MIKKLSKVIVAAILTMAFSGCEDEMMKIQQRQDTLLRQMTEEHGKIESIQAMVAASSNNLKLLDEKVTVLQKRVENTSHIPEQLTADVAASRIYVKEVADNLKMLREKTVEMLDIQNQRIAKGREAYIRVLEEEAKVLKTKLEEMNRAIDSLKQEMPNPDKEVPKEPTQKTQQ
jgi:chromosome segregation ATPase